MAGPRDVSSMEDAPAFLYLEWTVGGLTAVVFVLIAIALSLV